MKTRCPSCGATVSMDALVEHDGARRMLVELLRIDNMLSIAVIKYLSLHRPAVRDLTFTRTEKLLGELLPDIKAQRIERGGKVFDAPPQAWVWAIHQALAMRDAGKLITPLNGHGWLYEAITRWRPANNVLAKIDNGTSPPEARSQTLQAVTAMEGIKHGA